MARPDIHSNCRDGEDDEPGPIPYIQSQPFRLANIRAPLGSPAFSIGHGRHGSSSDIDGNSVRASRASSIVSTRTKVSINTLQEDARSNEDAQSIDLVIGGQSFRIARDGSSVTTSALQDSLPPYSPLGHRFITQDDTVSLMSAGNESLEAFSSERRRSRVNSVASDSTETAEQIENPDSGPISLDASTGPTNTEQTGPGPEELLASNDRPHSFVSVEHPTTTPTKGRSTSRPISLSSTEASNQPTPRRQGWWIVSAFSNLIGGNKNNVEDDKATLVGGNPSRHPLDDDNETVVGVSPIHQQIRDLDKFPRTQTFPQRPIDSSSPNAATTSITTRPLRPISSETFQIDPAASSSSSILPDTNEEVRSHYINMVRTIDHNYRIILHTRDKELANLRTRLNEIDQVYRAELRARDFTIDDLTAKLEYQEALMEAKLEQARHEVEDLWEQRWKDRDRHLMERMRRIEGDGERRVELAIEERDKEWEKRIREMGLNLQLAENNPDSEARMFYEARSQHESQQRPP
ncbi:hypothetical protein UCRPC4_g03204 [Phaeomoniella chlamydospora]|uniref:Uncharacterized protein n=1 Tax=Phaeomoniella chlamydospora TaxID=158046 RepID=A0A0G2EKJ3_PHACM|nr:hypothetical protein UCRPC4_g03204 [Phaeomoniella chlamydospora]